MRSSLTWLGLVAALVLVASGAVAHLSGVSVEAEPAASHEAPLCVPLCDVDSSRQGFVPGLVVVQEGVPVNWTSSDGDPHTASANPVQDTPGMIAEGSADHYPDACFDVHFQPGGSGEVVFDVREDGLYAKETSTFGGQWQACQAATELAEGWLVAYHCAIHPQFQQAGILVLPASPVPVNG